MNEEKLTEDQRKRIEDVRKKWMDEAEEKFQKWEEEDKSYREKHPQGLFVLDKHLGEQTEMEEKYKKMIQTILEERR